MNTPNTQSKPSLRERKKAKTILSIQQQALRLFHEQGYAATTIEQIAEAAEISPSTFFRYFPNKEDVVLYDNLDPLLFASFEAQPAELGVFSAMRNAFHEVFSRLSSDEKSAQFERARLIMTVPELRMRMMDDYLNMFDVVAGMFANRLGRPKIEFDLQILSGVLLGAMLTVFFTGMKDPQADFISLVDIALSQLENIVAL